MIKNKAFISAARVVGMTALFTALFAVLTFFKSMFPESLERYAHAFIGSIAAAISIGIFLLIDKQPFSSIGLKPSAKTPARFLLGFIGGVVLMGALALGVIYASGMKLVANPSISATHFLITTAALLPLAWMEEFAFRTWCIATLRKHWNPRMIVLITALLFGLYHLANGWSFQTAMLGAGVWGIVFGSIAYLTDGIAASIGMHYAVNLTTSAFASEPASNLWIIANEDGSPAASHINSAAEIWIPQLIMLAVAIIFLAWAQRSRK